MKVMYIAIHLLLSPPTRDMDNYVVNVLGRRMTMVVIMVASTPSP
jgi:hypothetical protein